MHAAYVTDVGLVRKENEDCCLVSAERGLFVVADGMGGHAGGQVASEMTVKIIDQMVRPPYSDDNRGQMLKNVLLEANRHVYNRGQDPELYGMGTTVTAVILQENMFHIAHIGDSRAYLYRNGRLALLTQDHSLVNEMLLQGSLTEEEAQNHPQRNILTRALGTQSNPKIDLQAFAGETGDLILLCTDGLYNHVSDSELTLILKENEAHGDQAVRNMLDLALNRGGADNITIVLVEI